MRKTNICHDCTFCREPDGKFTCLLLGDLAPQKECDHYNPPVGRYDNIDNLEDLMHEVLAHGLSVQQHDLNRVADIIGNTTFGELAAYAKSDKGNRLYPILFRVWHYDQAVSFYNEHALNVNGKSEELHKERDALKCENDMARKKIADLEEEVSHVWSKLRKDAEDNVDLANTNKEQAKMITELKAKLYDLMTAGA